MNINRPRVMSKSRWQCPCVISGFVWVFSVAAMFTALPVCARAAARNQSIFRWKNPIMSARLRDPQITVVGHTYYLTGTAPPFFPSLGQAPGAVIWKSNDLLHWKKIGVMIKPSRRYWYKKLFWAAEVFPWHHRFYLTVNCPAAYTPGHPQSVCLAVGKRIGGPYKVLTERHPLTNGNDADLFEDTDGKVYCFTAGINAVQVDLRTGRRIGRPFHILSPGGSGAWDGSSPGAPNVGIEGPCAYKIGPVYYVFYSSWGRGYEVGYATATNLHGPWKKYAHNPIYGAQGRGWCRQYKHRYTQKPGIPYCQAGGNSLFIGPNGKVSICAHAYRTHIDNVLHPHLVIDPLRYHMGWIASSGGHKRVWGVIFERTPVSYTPQHVLIHPGDYPPAEKVKRLIR